MDLLESYQKGTIWSACQSFGIMQWIALPAHRSWTGCGWMTQSREIQQLASESTIICAETQ